MRRCGRRVDDNRRELEYQHLASDPRGPGPRTRSRPQARQKGRRRSRLARARAADARQGARSRPARKVGRESPREPSEWRLQTDEHSRPKIVAPKCLAQAPDAATYRHSTSPHMGTKLSGLARGLAAYFSWLGARSKSPSRVQELPGL